MLYDLKKNIHLGKKAGHTFSSLDFALSLRSTTSTHFDLFAYNLFLIMHIVPATIFQPPRFKLGFVFMTRQAENLCRIEIKQKS